MNKTTNAQREREQQYNSNEHAMAHGARNNNTMKTMRKQKTHINKNNENNNQPAKTNDENQDEQQ